MRRYPYEYWARYLVTRYGVKDATLGLEQLGFGVVGGHGTPISQPYLHALRAEIELDRPVPLNATDPKTDRWLRVNRIHGAMGDHPDVLAAKEILRDPILRKAMELLAMSGLPSEYVAQAYTLATQEELRPGVVDAFAHYFWNRQLLSREDWQDFLITKDATGKWDVDRYSNGVDLWYALRGDPQVALWKTGLLTDIDDQTFVSMMKRDVLGRWIETSMKPNGLSTAETYKSYAAVYFKALEMESQGQNAYAKAIQLLHGIQLQQRQRNPDLILGDGKVLKLARRVPRDEPALLDP